MGRGNPIDAHAHLPMPINAHLTKEWGINGHGSPQKGLKIKPPIADFFYIHRWYAKKEPMQKVALKTVLPIWAKCEKNKTKITNKNGTILEKFQNKFQQQKRYYWRKVWKITNKKGTISVKSQNLATKVVPFWGIYLTFVEKLYFVNWAPSTPQN